ncbi:MAG: hypothetical protein QN173_10840 [Armatimonadota bacterium]|nr:hypothetical protein [Armatimonadota bacterium]MDR7401194.1 hypothetical protein [Armatimonadota bacterium]MDR7403046.1 hypothetical protein [Armatimonadota bacterium]MDR7438199.1 hypothetical protein [Armatimonadota bacterium]MDR7471847.1 hypothetical protein [Armatimonadota bacterium]
MDRRWKAWGAVGALVAWGLMPAGARAAAMTVSIQVSPVQRLEGATTVQVTSAGVADGTVVVKSNIPWVLVADAAGADVLWRAAGGTWQRVGDRSPVLSGPPGVHEVGYQLRLASSPGGPVQVRLSLTPALR